MLIKALTQREGPRRRKLSMKKKIAGVDTADIDKQLAKVQKGKKRDLEN